MSTPLIVIHADAWHRIGKWDSALTIIAWALWMMVLLSALALVFRGSVSGGYLLIVGVVALGVRYVLGWLLENSAKRWFLSQAHEAGVDGDEASTFWDNFDWDPADEEGARY